MDDNFLTQKNCDRCHRSLAGGRIMSMFTTECICMECAEAERSDPEYDEAVRAEREQLLLGNRNFKGIRG